MIFIFLYVKFQSYRPVVWENKWSYESFLFVHGISLAVVFTVVVVGMTQRLGHVRYLCENISVAVLLTYHRRPTNDKCLDMSKIFTASSGFRKEF